MNKNLYMMSNSLPYDFEKVKVTNYHFVPSYKTPASDPSYTSEVKFNATEITNCYYYDWNKIFFKEIADTYNAKSGSIHSFIMKAESEAKYTKESFYPFEGFEPYLEKCGVRYFHSTNSTSAADYKTNEEFPYEAYMVDERVKSITTPLLSSTNLIETINFDTLDIRGYSLGSMSSLKGENVIVSNSSSSFNTQYIKFKNIYFTYDVNGSNITSVTANGTMTIEKIYIPEANKTKFSEITNNSNLSGKVIYYTNEIKTDFVFTNTTKTKTYKSSDNFIDINTTLNSVQLLETSGVTIPTNAYINEFLATYQLPTEQEETSVITPKYDLARFFVFTENIDIKKAVEELKPYLLYKNGKLSTEKYTLEYKITDDEKLELKGKYPDGKEFNFTVDYKVITSNVGEFAGVDRLGNGDFTLIVEARKIKERITAKDLMKLFIDNIRPQNAIPSFKLPITLTKEGISTRESVKYKNANDEEVTAYAQIIITNNDLNPAGFKDEFYTTKDEFGKASMIDLFKDKMTENPSLKWVSAGISAIVGLIIIYIIFVLTRKTLKWLKA